MESYVERPPLPGLAGVVRTVLDDLVDQRLGLAELWGGAMLLQAPPAGVS